eukprot:CAMPEP_0114260902 /NCGR_PEP_ID=MMETSP0058-20121206/20779_1 /TAXON_ID=36894 /ORGANISM="Pyramimonas parkeae, CCMP726" /LENGTH=192 /DNA_ID=CAMNT_0001376257 /DNA_START=134 /DNA_END=712 /DNA_ORIENTATION=-
MDNHERAAELQNVWANAFDGWYRLPDADVDVVFLCPKVQKEQGLEPGGSLELPATVLASRVFAVTAWNPLGDACTREINVAANKELLQEIERLSNTNNTPRVKCWWESFGFSSEWREDGFSIAFGEEEADSGRDAVVELAQKFKQGAIYEYIPTSSPFELLRKTVPVLIPGVEADQIMVRCAKPATPNAEHP